MIKSSALLAGLLLAFASAAHAQTSPPPKPVTGQGAATTVETNPAAVESKGKADKGLGTAESNITKPHPRKHKRAEKSRGMEEKAEHPSGMERPERPDRPERPGY